MPRGKADFTVAAVRAMGGPRGGSNPLSLTVQAVADTRAADCPPDEPPPDPADWHRRPACSGTDIRDRSLKCLYSVSPARHAQANISEQKLSASRANTA